MHARTTGSFAVYATNGKEVTPRGRKARALLAYLLCDAGAKVPRARLAGLLWGDRGEAQARSSFRQVLLELRRALNGMNEFIFSDREHIWIDADGLVEEPEDLEADPKEPFADLDNITPEFDEWLVAERARRATARIAALKAQAEELLANGLAAESVSVIDQIHALDPSDEDALRLGMKAEFQCGRTGQIARRYETVAAVLREDLGVEPSNRTRNLLDELLTPQTSIDPATSRKFCALYEAVERSLDMGAWECDLLTGQICWTPGTFALFGLPQGSPILRQEILEQYEASSRERLEAVRDEAIRRCTGFSVEVDIFTPAGERKRLRINAEVESRDGTPLRIFGTKQLVARATKSSPGRQARSQDMCS